MGTDHDPVKPSLSRNARGKLSRSVINKTIPALLRSDPRARRGVEATELIVDPPPAVIPPPAGDKQPSSLSSSANQGIQKHKRGKSRVEHDDPLPPSQGNVPNQVAPGQDHEPKITLVNCDTLLAAYNLFHTIPKPQHGRKQQPRIAILNMASPLRPGGGVLSGATSQEESLCRRTTLYPSLRDEFYRLPEAGGVYTPDVLVFHSGYHHSHTGSRRGKRTTEDDQAKLGEDNEDGSGAESESESEGETGSVKVDDKKDWFHVDVITAAMLRFPDLAEGTGPGADEVEDQDQVIVLE